MTEQRTLILGGGGMLAHAFRHLLGTTHSLQAPARAEVDICDYPCLEAAFARIKPTLVLNCAAHTKVDLCDFQKDLAHAINATAAGDAATLARKHGAKLVHFSTDFVFPGDSPRPWKETDPVGPLSEYGRSKLAGERLVQANNPDALILRTSWLYGPGGPCFPATMVKLARMGKPLAIVADQHGSPTFTYDLARATMELVGKDAKGVFHLSNTGETTWHDFTAEILRAWNLQTDLSKITSADWQKKTPWSAHRPHRSTMDVSKAETVLGHPLRPWKEALKEYRSLEPV